MIIYDKKNAIIGSYTNRLKRKVNSVYFNPLNTELNPICP